MILVIVQPNIYNSYYIEHLQIIDPGWNGTNEIT